MYAPQPNIDKLLDLVCRYIKGNVLQPTFRLTSVDAATPPQPISLFFFTCEYVRYIPPSFNCLDTYHMYRHDIIIYWPRFLGVFIVIFLKKLWSKLVKRNNFT